MREKPEPTTNNQNAFSRRDAESQRKGREGTGCYLGPVIPGARSREEKIRREKPVKSVLSQRRRGAEKDTTRTDCYLGPVRRSRVPASPAPG